MPVGPAQVASEAKHHEETRQRARRDGNAKKNENIKVLEEKLKVKGNIIIGILNLFWPLQINKKEKVYCVSCSPIFWTFCDDKKFP